MGGVTSAQTTDDHDPAGSEELGLRELKKRQTRMAMHRVRRTPMPARRSRVASAAAGRVRPLPAPVPAVARCADPFSLMAARPSGEASTQPPQAPDFGRPVGFDGGNAAAFGQPSGSEEDVPRARQGSGPGYGPGSGTTER